MNRIRSFSNLHKKSKEAAVASGDGSKDHNDDVNTDGWRGKRPSALLIPPRAGWGGSPAASRSVSTEKGPTGRPNAAERSALGLDPPPCLPPLLLSSPSSPSPSASPLTPPTSGEGRREMFSPSLSDNHSSARAPVDELLSLPKPAFLGGGRMSGSSQQQYITGGDSMNASTSSLNSSTLSSTSSQSAELNNTSSRSASTSRFAQEGRQSHKLEDSSTEHQSMREGPSKAGVRSNLRTIGRRFLPTRNSTLLHTPDEQDDRRSPSLCIDLPSPGSDRSNSMPATPSLSSTSASYSSSSCTSLVTEMPKTPTSAGLPALLPAAAPVAKMKGSPLSETVRRGSFSSPSPFVITEEPLQLSPSKDTTAAMESSDFLQAVLNFCTTDDDVDTITNNASAGTKSPTSHPYSYTYPISAPAKPGQKVLTQMDAAKMLEEERSRRATGKKTSQHRFAYRSPWAVQEEEDSEDEYGGENDEEQSSTTSPKPSKEYAFQTKSTAIHRVAGLDTAAKKAMYACTVMKFHPQLANGLNLGISSTEVRLPRSVNPAMTLEGHPSTSSHTRSMRIWLARSKLIRRLRTQTLPLEVEQELEWFARKYLPHYIAPEQLGSHLAQKAAENSLEALVRPPLAQGKENSMALWAGRPSFQVRCDVIEDFEVTAPFGKEYTVFYDCDVHIPHPMPLQLSQRCRALAGAYSANAVGNTSGKKAKKGDKGPRRLAPPWMKAPAASNTGPETQPSEKSTPFETEAAADRERPGHEKKDSDDSQGEEDVPLAMLMDRRGGERRFSVPGADFASPSHDFHAWQMQQHLERERANRRQRELQLIEDQKRLLEKARERRQKQYQMDILTSPTYGAGNPLFDPKHGRANEPSSLMSPSRSPRKQPSGSPAKSPAAKSSMAGRASPLLQGFQSRHSPRLDEQPAMPDWRLSHANLTAAMMSTSPPPATSPSIMSMSQGYPTMQSLPQMIPAPYGVMPMSSRVLMSPPFYQIPHSNSTMQPLVSLSPEQIPTSARRYRVNVEC